MTGPSTCWCIYRGDYWSDCVLLYQTQHDHIGREDEPPQWRALNIHKERRSPYHDYSHLGEDVDLVQRFRDESRKTYNTLRDTSWMNCQYYLRGKPQYQNIEQIENIGSRTEKHWFRVYDGRSRSSRILTVANKSPKMLISFSDKTCTTLKDMLMLLQHPYIFPVCDLDFVIDQKLVVVLQTIAVRGSLKDYIYQSKCMDLYLEKYRQKNRGLLLGQLQLFGRQILAALLYLEEKGFPPHGHVRSANIMLENNCCRLAACENTFLGYESPIYPLIKKRLKKAKEAIDVISFGHLLYEMCVGFELDTAHPEPSHLIMCQNPQVVKLLNFIFQNENGVYPTIRQVADHEFFYGVQLTELELSNLSPISLSAPMKSLVKMIQDGKPVARKSKTDQSKPALKSRKMSISTETSGVSSKAATPPPPPPPPPPPLGASTFNAPPLYPGFSSVQVSPVPLGPHPPAYSPTFSSAPSRGEGRSALLGDIQRGAQLKKTTTRDRSAPRI